MLKCWKNNIFWMCFLLCMLFLFLSLLNWAYFKQNKNWKMCWLRATSEIFRWVFAQIFRCTTVQTVQFHFTTHGNHWKARWIWLNLIHINKLYFIVRVHLDPLPFVYFDGKSFFAVQNFILFVQQKRIATIVYLYPTIKTSKNITITHVWCL